MKVERSVLRDSRSPPRRSPLRRSLGELERRRREAGHARAAARSLRGLVVDRRRARARRRREVATVVSSSPATTWALVTTSSGAATQPEPATPSPQAVPSTRTVASPALRTVGVGDDPLIRGLDVGLGPADRRSSGRPGAGPCSSGPDGGRTSFSAARIADCWIASRSRRASASPACAGRPPRCPRRSAAPGLRAEARRRSRRAPRPGCRQSAARRARPTPPSATASKAPTRTPVSTATSGASGAPRPRRAAPARSARRAQPRRRSRRAATRSRSGRAGSRPRRARARRG